MSLATSLSRVTGFVRTWATAYALGATTLAAAYSVANNIPNMIFELVAGGILSSLFIPTFLEIKARRNEQEAWRFANHVFNVAVLALGVVAIIGILLPQPFIWTQTFRLPSESAAPVREMASFFFRFFAIQVVVYGGGMVMQGLLNAERSYLWTALGPVFNNVVVIVTLLTVARIGADTTQGLVVLALGTTLGVVAMFAVMFPDLKRRGVRYHAELGLGDPDVRHMLVLAIPTVIYVVTNLIAVSFRNASAFAVAENGPSILWYAWNFYQLPYGVLAVALATAIFTELSESAGRRDMAAFKNNFGAGLRTTAVLIIPSAAALFALSVPLVSLYRVGAFEEASVAPVASALRLWAIALVFYASMMFVLRTFYSLKDTKTPAMANVVLTIVQVGLYWTLSTGFGDWAGLGLNGIPVADTVFYVLLLATLAVVLRRRIGGYDLKGVLGVYGKMIAASLVGGVAAYYAAGFVEPLLSGVASALLQVAVGGVACFVIAFGLGNVMHVAEVRSVSKLGRRLIGRIGGRS